MGALGGYDAKDKELIDGFNPEKLGGLTKKEKARANALRALEIGRKNREERLRVAKLEAEEKQRAIEAGTYQPPPEEKEDEILGSQMFQDMRFIYKKLNGRNKLEAWAKDDKNFMTLAKELMKQELALLTAKIRKGEGEGPNGQNQNFFVVLKGLEDTKIVAGAEDKTVDMKQIHHVLEPESGAYEPDQPEVEKQRLDTPEGW